MSNLYKNLKVLETLEDVKATFKPQLEEAPKCDGDYLKGQTLEEAAKQYMENIIKQFPGMQMTYEQSLEVMTRKEQEHKDHVGQAQLFYMREVLDEKTENGARRILCEIVKIWESDLEQLVGVKYAGPISNSSNLPRFIQHDLTGDGEIRIAR